jgi:hypothetical protein
MRGAHPAARAGARGSASAWRLTPASLVPRAAHAADLDVSSRSLVTESEATRRAGQRVRWARENGSAEPPTGARARREMMPCALAGAPAPASAPKPAAQPLSPASARGRRGRAVRRPEASQEPWRLRSAAQSEGNFEHGELKHRPRLRRRHKARLRSEATSPQVLRLAQATSKGHQHGLEVV